MPSPTSGSVDEDVVDPRLEPTVNAVNWDALSAIACDIYRVESATWGQQFNGGYNVVRFLLLGDENGTEIVARVPYRPEDGMTDERAEALGRRIASEVATMEYVAEQTKIPVPRVIAHNIEKDGDGVGSPYILMSKMDGAPLSSLWDDMEDEKREVILRQVVDILLQLSSVRFDSIGALFKGDGNTKPAWYIEPQLSVLDIDDFSVLRAISGRLYSNALDYWTSYANANLERIDKEDFGHVNKSYGYVMAWFLRSLIPTLFDTSLDTKGFSLSPGDFHSQNIMVTHADTSSPRITAVIDWEFTSTDPTSTFAQYPLFIVDHPYWNDDHPLKPRNMQDQATFNRLMREAESKSDPEGGLPLSQAYETCYGVYLFQQCMSDPAMFNVLYQPLFQHIFGEQDKDEEDFSVTYYQALMNGILKKKTDQLEKEAAVKQEAVKILGDEVVTFELTRSGFKDIVLEHRNKFEPQGEVMEWLTLYGKN
ncbi:hypothetical protein M422DRAFT_31690 [Sphaerobolus stellatus SS14]|uniref:Aminoglycoside phosphotransferase domain-containing protein n=1 Tax=Sphaerobolus stellatus (strain SS14) TaxID=990650 RepID=A0A0C9VJE8_SPHS4|nr:hypothetical protein M422DRAFT_31690 [Sphaerobolus stellatus SS14]